MYAPSSWIDESQLASIEEVVASNPNLTTLSRAGKLACKLAREAVFGEEVMRRCTPLGNKERPGLPLHEMNVLKRAMREIFSYVLNAMEFERMWKRCMEAVQQACKRLRSKTNEPTTHCQLYM